MGRIQQQQLRPIRRDSQSFADSDRFERLWLALAGSFIALAAAVVLRCPVPPLQDFGEWIYQGYLAKLLLLHGHGGIPGIVFKTWPVPNALSQTILTALMLLFSPVAAARLFLTGYLLAGAWALRRMSRCVRATSPNLLFFASLPLLLVDTSFWTGEMNYQIGLLVFLSYVVSSDAQRRRPSLVLLTSLLLFATHILPLLFFCLFVALDWRPRVPRDPRRLLALAPACVLALWWFAKDGRAGGAASFSPTLHGPVQFAEYRAYLFAKLGVYHNFVYDGVGDWRRHHRVYCAGVAVNALVLVCLAAILGAFLISSLRSRRWEPAAVLAVVCTALGLVDPAALMRNANVGERCLLPALALALLLGRDGSLWRRAVLGGVGSVALLLLASAAVSPPLYREAGRAPGGSVVNDPHARLQVLFWVRPYSFARRVVYAQEASLGRRVGAPFPLGFEEGLLRTPPGGPGR